MSKQNTARLKRAVLIMTVIIMLCSILGCSPTKDQYGQYSGSGYTVQELSKDAIDFSVIDDYIDQHNLEQYHAEALKHSPTFTRNALTYPDTIISPYGNMFVRVRFAYKNPLENEYFPLEDESGNPIVKYFKVTSTTAPNKVQYALDIGTIKTVEVPTDFIYLIIGGVYFSNVPTPALKLQEVNKSDIQLNKIGTPLKTEVLKPIKVLKPDSTTNDGKTICSTNIALEGNIDGRLNESCLLVTQLCKMTDNGLQPVLLNEKPITRCYDVIIAAVDTVTQVTMNFENTENIPADKLFISYDIYTYNQSGG